MSGFLARWKTWIGIAASLLAILWAAYGVDWGLAGVALAEADRLLLAVVFVLTPVIYIGMRALRWKILLRPERTGFGNLIEATAIGLMANNILPARIGEFVRAYVLARSEDLSPGTTFGALVVERILDGLTLVGILVVLVFVRPFPQWVESTIWVAMAFFAIALLLQVVIVSPGGSRLVLRLVIALERRFPDSRVAAMIARTTSAVIDGFRALRDPASIALSFALAMVQWILVGATFWIAMLAFGFAGEAGWSGALFTEAVTGVGVAIPSSPGFVGTFHALVVESLHVLNIERTLAFSYAMGLHAINYVSITVVGLFYFYKRGLSWSELEQSEEEVEVEVEAEHLADIQEVSG